MTEPFLHFIPSRWQGRLDGNTFDLTMETFGRLGRFLFAAAIAATGMQHLIYAHLRGGLGPPWIPQNPLWAYLTGAILVISALCLLAGRQVEVAAAVIAAVCFLAALVLQVPGLIADIHDAGPWTGGFELLALSGIALALMGSASSAGHSHLAIVTGRSLFALTLPVFGVQHFLYANYVASLVPAWIPGHYFWAIFVGCAFLAAALAILTQKLAGLAASLLGVMFLSWVLVLHAPRILRALHGGNEWTSGFVALAMAGGAFIVSATFADARQKSAEVRSIARVEA